MSRILQDLSAPALVHAIEANQFEAFLLFQHWPQAEVHNDADTLWTITDIPFWFFNGVFRAQLAPDTVDAAIERAVARCKSRNVPMLWWTGPATTPANLGTHLEAHGFTHEADSSGMAVDLSSLNESRPIPSGLTIEQVNDSETLKAWGRAFGNGFGVPDLVADAYCDFLRSLGLGAQSPMHNIIGWLEGEPVATASLFLGGSVAGIYAVATIPEARRRGIGAAMTQSLLLEARSKGYKAGILHARERAVGVYRSVGFQEYCKIGQYMWLPEHEQETS